MKENKNILPDKPGFRIPDNYFANMENVIFSKISSEENILDQNATSGFSIPDQYFEGLEDSILNKMEEPNQAESHKNEFFYIAASIAAVVLLYFGINIEKSGESDVTWDSIELSAIENYIDEGYEMGFIDLNTVEYEEFIGENDKLVSDEDFMVVNEDVALEYIDGNVENSDFILE